MNIITISFEEPLILIVKDEVVRVIAFQTAEHGNIKFGIQAPRSINVHREEIFQAIQQQLELQKGYVGTIDT